MEIFAAIAVPIFILMFTFGTWYAARRRAVAARVLSLFIPFSAVLWLIVLHRLIARRRSPYFHQFLVFAAMAILMYAMIKLGIYRLG